MNIYNFELKRLIKSILIWGISISGFLVFYLAFFPSISSTSFADLFNDMDPKFLAAFGMIPELPIDEIFGYYNLTMGMILIPIAIQASNYGFHILSVEERELTADFLFTKPISRSKIIFSKFFAALTSLLIVDLFVVAATFISITSFKGTEVVEYNNVVILLLSLPFFQLTFISIGMVISVSIKKVSSVLSFSMGLAFGLYIINSFGSVLSSENLRYITPYAHFNPAYPLINGSWDWSLIWISLVVMVCSLIASYFLYLRRNIASL
ncbi:MAG: ABC transporter permease subunit [Tenericutes bacterium]|nr:ABC transporter permease subunit [Mycoplasmatota bacterium]